MVVEGESLYRSASAVEQERRARTDGPNRRNRMAQRWLLDAESALRFGPVGLNWARTSDPQLVETWQVFATRSHPFAYPAWLYGLRYGVPNPSERERTLGVPTVPTKA